jgi:hypothetical protein
MMIVVKSSLMMSHVGDQERDLNDPNNAFINLVAPACLP